MPLPLVPRRVRAVVLVAAHRRHLRHAGSSKGFRRRTQIGEEIRDLGSAGPAAEDAAPPRWAASPPTLGIAILVPVLLVGDLGNVYVRLMLVSTVWLGLLGGRRRLHQGLPPQQGGAQRSSSRSWDRWASASSSARSMCASPDSRRHDEKVEPSSEQIFADDVRRR